LVFKTSGSSVWGICFVSFTFFCSNKFFIYSIYSSKRKKSLFDNNKNIIRINSEFNRIDRYKYINFPFFYVENVHYEQIIKENGITLYEPINNNCWATPAPCTSRGTKVEKFMFFKVFYGK